MRVHLVWGPSIVVGHLSWSPSIVGVHLTRGGPLNATWDPSTGVPSNAEVDLL